MAGRIIGRSRSVVSGGLLGSSCVLEVLNVAVEEDAVAAAWVDGPALEVSIDGRDGLREVRVDGEFDVAHAVRITDGCVVGSLEVGESLRLGFGPKVLEAYGIIRTIKSPQPVTADGRIGIGGSCLGALNGVAER